MEIQIISDIHTEFGVPLHKLIEPKAEICICAGDMSNANGTTTALLGLGTMFKTVIAVMGNHDYYHGNFSDRVKLVKEELTNTNVHLLDCDEYIIDDIRFLGCTLWSDLNHEDWFVIQAAKRINDFYMIRNQDASFSTAAMMNRHAYEVSWLEKMLHSEYHKLMDLPTVVITHFLPSLMSCHQMYAGQTLNHYFAANCDELAANSNAKFWIHGHTHSPCDYMLGDTRVLANPRGYPNERKTYSEVVIEI